MTKQYKQSKASEILWLAVALMSLIAGIHKTVNISFSSAWYFFGFVLIALLMYYIRRTMRQKNN